MPHEHPHRRRARRRSHPTVLLPGDPLRAKWIAETFLEDATCYNEVRGMSATPAPGRASGSRVQGSGMGQPSLAIYANELFQEYDVQSVVRVGSCGALVEKVGVRDVVIASGACTDSGMNRLRFHGLDYAPVADFGLLRAAYDAAQGARRRHRVHVGLIFSGDQFYTPRPELMAPMVEHGVLAVEMEASALYTLAAKYGRKALAICTVSDHIVTGEETTAQERQETFSRDGRDRPGGVARRLSASRAWAVRAKFPLDRHRPARPLARFIEARTRTSRDGAVRDGASLVDGDRTACSGTWRLRAAGPASTLLPATRRVARQPAVPARASWPWRPRGRRSRGSARLERSSGSTGPGHRAGLAGDRRAGYLAEAPGRRRTPCVRGARACVGLRSSDLAGHRRRSTYAGA